MGQPFQSGWTASTAFPDRLLVSRGRPHFRQSRLLLERHPSPHEIQTASSATHRKFSQTLARVDGLRFGQLHRAGTCRHTAAELPSASLPSPTGACVLWPSGRGCCAREDYSCAAVRSPLGLPSRGTMLVSSRRLLPQTPQSLRLHHLPALARVRSSRPCLIRPAPLGANR